MSGDAELAELLAAWDAFAASVRERLVAGHAVYGESWKKRGVEGNLREAQGEALDLAAYGFFAWALAAGEREGPHGRE